MLFLEKVVDFEKALLKIETIYHARLWLSQINRVNNSFSL
jgi:hypothetical protein